jgi:hypothetical protein
MRATDTQPLTSKQTYLINITTSAQFPHLFIPHHTLVA